MFNFKDLETKGFLVIKNFLSDNALETIEKKYKTLLDSKSSKNKNYNLIGSKDDNFHQWITPIVNSISKTTNLDINCVMPGCGYFSNQLVNFDWHQDHECYYRWQDMYNAINCWIPIIKPNKYCSGISIIPHDVWADKYPNIYKDHILGKGAKRFIKLNNGTTDMYDDTAGDSINLPFYLDDLSVTPILDAGDVLILRQDMVHRTQDNLDDRLSISIRCRNSNGILTKNNLLISCQYKDMMIKNNPEWYDDFMEKFKSADQIKIKNIIKPNY
jgi:hypothetical protein